MVKVPPNVARGLTVDEKRARDFERVTLRIVLVVAVIAAVISFFAVSWVGQQMGMSVVLAWLLPLAIDGFAVACSLGIVRSQAAGKSARSRVSEWLGLGYALSVSVVDNTVHALHAVTGMNVEVWLAVANASAVPVIVAYGLHILGRAMQGGVGGRQNADDPDRIYDAPIAHAPAAPVARTHARTADRERAPERAPARAPRQTPQPVQAPIPAPQPVRVYDEVDEAAYARYAADRDLGREWLSSEVGAAVGVSPSQGSRRRAVWRNRYEAEGRGARPDLTLDTDDDTTLQAAG